MENEQNKIDEKTQGVGFYKPSLRIGKRCIDVEYNWLDFTDCEISVDEPCVVCLGGGESTDPKKANGFAKLVEQPDVPIYSVWYDVGETELAKIAGMDYGFELGDYKNNYVVPIKDVFSKKRFLHARSLFSREHVSERVVIDKNTKGEIICPMLGDFELKKDFYSLTNVDILYEKLIKPRVSDINGKKLNLQEAQRRIRNLHIIAHCYGACLALEMEKIALKEMIKLGYTQKECEKIFEQLLILSSDSNIPLGKSKAQFISVISANDYVRVNEFNVFYRYISYLKSCSKKMDNFFYRICLYRGQGFFERKIKWLYNMRENIKVACQNKLFEKNFYIAPSFFPDRRGNFFFVTRKLCNRTIREEHGIAIFEIGKKAKEYNFEPTADALKVEKMIKNILRNALDSAKTQQGKFIELPPLEQLVYGENPAQDKKLFENMCKNGEILWKQIKTDRDKVQISKKTSDEIRAYRQKMREIQKEC